MGVLTDLLSGRLFRFKSALGTDVNLGTSDKLILTPKSVKDSELIREAVVTVSFPLDTAASSSNATFAFGTRWEIMPPTGNDFGFTARANQFSARLHIYGKVDSGATGEVCLVDAATGSIVNGSSIIISSTSYSILSSSPFTIDSNKLYTYGLRRVTGALFTSAFLRSALLSFTIPKA